MTRRAWTGTERVLIRDNYVSKGATWCAEQTGRTRASVRMFALKNGFTKGDLTKKSSPQIDAFIRRAYESGRGGPATAAKTLGVTVQWVARRAGELGLSAQRDCRPYSEAEARFIEQHAHLNRATISSLMRQRGWRRTAAAIQKFITFSRFDNEAFMGAEALGLCLGVTANAIRSWTSQGLLIGQHRGRGSDPFAGRLVYSSEDVAAFIVRHPTRIDMRKVDGPWLIDLIARHGAAGLVEAKDKGARIVAIKAAFPERTPAEIAAMVDSTPAAVSVTLSKAKARLQSDARAA